MGDFDGFNFTPADLHGISMAALELIVAEEDSDKNFYNSHYAHLDWPEGASGPTVGIGVDLGYMTPSEVRENFAGICDDATINAMVRGCGIKGEAAGVWVRMHRNSVTITWDQAIREFIKAELPQWVLKVITDIPGADKLPPDCLGAIVSLAYNRGDGGFKSPGSRYSEMRAIRTAVINGDLKAIPDLFLSMRRLWPQGGDLWRRRGHEASLFANGLPPEPGRI